MSLGLRHYHKQKQKQDKNKDWEKIIDPIVYLVGILGPIFTIPQIAKIYLGHTAAGVSAFSWISYSIFSVFWLIYGILHKEKLIIISYSLWILTNSAVAIGAIIYAK
jgi:uncharacterized protein with PQ loop repeat